MGSGVDRNAACPCGSGKKYKKCCLISKPPPIFSREERESALARLSHFSVTKVGAEKEGARADFWGPWQGRQSELGDHWLGLSDYWFDMWFFFDYNIEPERLVVDEFLAMTGSSLSSGERAYLHAMKSATMRPCEVVGVVPGVSVTLRDVLEGGLVTVHERCGSRSMMIHDLCLTRINPLGSSGHPEMDGGVYPISQLAKPIFMSFMNKQRAEWIGAEGGHQIDLFYKSILEDLHQLWIEMLLDPPIPQMATTDGEVLLLTEMHFDIVLDSQQVTPLLDAIEVLEREGTATRWGWSGKNKKGDAVALGGIEIRATGLILTTNSRERGERFRTRVEEALGNRIRHKITSHKDMTLEIKSRLKRKVGPDAAEFDDNEPSEDAQLPYEVNEALVLDHLSKHYRSWLDEKLEALDGRSPREATEEPDLRERTCDLIRGLEGIYQNALKRGEPAYDPSWMWDELGLRDDSDTLRLPPLASERLYDLIDGTAEACVAIVTGARNSPDFDDKCTLIDESDISLNLEAQRALRNIPYRTLENPPQVSSSANTHSSVSRHLIHAANFELHRRKTFWVAESLVYMLSQTDVDVVGNDLRLPFAAFVVAFTDRYALSLAERWLARRQDSPLVGHLLKILTVYLTGTPSANDERLIKIGIAMDSLGSDLPALYEFEVLLRREEPVTTAIERVAPNSKFATADGEPFSAAAPLRGLLHLIFNTVLYATSAGVEPEIRRGTFDTRFNSKSWSEVPSTPSDEEVYYLPGVIEISLTRRFQELERTVSGRPILRRFMVRGHWRRPASQWTDQRMRWIKPHWKGPDMAAVIERAYRLKP
jgi:hypothetical protein